MDTVCFDCTKYDPTDRLAQLLAYLCSAPYCAVFYQASVVYCRRELHAITVLLGMVVNAALGKVLKRLIRQARPLAGCELLGSCAKHGMPSSHVQLMFFMCALHALLVWRRNPRSRVQMLFQLAESTILGLVSAAVAVGRVYLGYHDISQVAVGAVVGCGFAVVWFGAMVWLARHWFGRVVRWRLSEVMRIKDTFSLGPDILSWERRQTLCIKQQ
ncbi:Dolichyldiphosphatase 1 [Coccomyxa sp. Obi]|nr:Dolichyldiphosphatase 1 [Coccomyxa sp. Obi]